MKYAVLLVLAALCAGCDGGAKYPFATYSGRFNAETIAETEAVIDELAGKYQYDVVRQDPEEMAELSGGAPAFLTALYCEDDLVLVVSNVGVSGKIRVQAFDYDALFRSEVELALNDLITQLETELDLSFEVDEST